MDVSELKELLEIVNTLAELNFYLIDRDEPLKLIEIEEGLLEKRLSFTFDYKGN